ncbi:MAG TPA: SIMPL domain-containing protein, partial [Candidatus Saccharimonadales bacterium]|nr:SIMPL domain-containing protein [Candidatus Saccharimonadales bacterium]
MQEDQTSDSPTVTSSSPPQTPSRKRITLPNVWQTIIILLLVIIAIMVFMWKPWEPNIKASQRTIAVTGSATVSATPDEYVFSPNYRFTNADKQTALNELTGKSEEIIKRLKSLGVP